MSSRGVISINERLLIGVHHSYINETLSRRLFKENPQTIEAIIEIAKGSDIDYAEESLLSRFEPDEVGDIRYCGDHWCFQYDLFRGKWRFRELGGGNSAEFLILKHLSRKIKKAKDIPGNLVTDIREMCCHIDSIRCYDWSKWHTLNEHTMTLEKWFSPGADINYDFSAI